MPPPMDVPTRAMINLPLPSNTGRYIKLVRPYAWQAFPFLIREYNSLATHKVVLTHDVVKTYRAPTLEEIWNFKNWSVNSASLDVLCAYWSQSNESFTVHLTFNAVKGVLQARQKANALLCEGRPHKSWVSWQCEWCGVYQFYGIERPHAEKCSLAIGNCQLRQRLWFDGSE